MSILKEVSVIFTRFCLQSDVHPGSISPSLLTFGSPLGLSNIDQEDSTNDGVVFDPLTQSIPKILGHSTLIRAVDGLEFQTRDAL